MATKRKPGGTVTDRWHKRVKGELVRSASYGKGAGTRYRARYVDPQGREHAKGFRLKRDADDWLTSRSSEMVTGTWTDPKLAGRTFGELAARWLTTKATRAPKTVAGYKSLLDVVVLPRWEDVPLREITFEDYQDWVSLLSVSGSTRFEGKGLSASRVIQAHQVATQVLQYAVRAKHIPSNPTEGVDLPRKPEVDQRYLTHEQVHRLGVAAGRFRTLVFVLAYCGLRFGEVVALKISDVDLDARRIRVRRSVTYVTGSGQLEGPTKNHSTRSVPVPKFLVPLLRSEMGDRDGGALVFPSRRDGWLTEGEVRWVFDPAARAIGEKGLTLHQLRHTCASLAITGGANVKVLQTLLGHKTATLTLDRYGHLFPDDLDKIADAFDLAVESADDLRTISPLKAVNSRPKSS